jgi:hypothetical protein
MSKQKVNRMPGIHLHATLGKGTAFPKEFYWILIAKNGKTIAKSSETYKTKRAALASINVMLILFDAQDMCLYYDHTPKGKENEPDLFVIR